ncbi:MAG TPA: hypothetical protein VEF33_09675, partial [Syntrophales bacterium]|nr:hypothetical protein [Syntrophales bacterium]
PEKKAEIFARAGQYGYHRMVGGVHYRSDIEAGRISGTVIAAIMMQHPDFQEEFSRARNEIRRILQLPQPHWYILSGIQIIGTKY